MNLSEIKKGSVDALPKIKSNDDPQKSAYQIVGSMLKPNIIANIIDKVKDGGDTDRRQYDSAAGSSNTKSSDELNLDNKYERSAEFKNKSEKMMYSRNWNARLWVIIVMTYYVIRLTFIIYPWWEYNTQ